jgi:Family of unknown function (DUF5677)
MDFYEEVRRALAEGLEIALSGLDEQRLAKLMDDPEAAVSPAVQEALAATTRDLVERLKQDGPSMLEERRAYRASYENRLAERWAQAFDLAEMAMVVAFEAGEAFNEKHQSKAKTDGDLVFAALVRLHARACRIADEVLVLLKAGFGQAGQARWRVLHEVAVVAGFIKTHGQDTAERYFSHEGVETWRGMQEYQRHAASLGETPYSEQELNLAKARFDALCRRYGSKFAGPYGWAQQALAAEDPGYVTARATISATETSVGVSHLRPYYRMASHGVHANPKGITFTPDVLAGEPLLLAGPSFAGLADPGHSALISLTQATGTLLTSRTGESAPLILGALLQLTREAGDAYLEADRAVQAEAAAASSTYLTGASTSGRGSDNARR